ncbi:hypothetical protein J3F83DRAFT_713788 [Trichoderma novae-zelandiae]
MSGGIFTPGTDYRDFAGAVDKLDKYQVIVDRQEEEEKKKKKYLGGYSREPGTEHKLRDSA